MATATPTTSHAGTLRLAAERRGRETVATLLEGHMPYAARVVPGRPGWARIVLVQTIAGPLAGDRATIDVDVGPGAALELTANAATLAFPVPAADDSSSARASHEVRIRVAEGGRLAWLPEPLILAAECDLEASLELDLAAGATAVTRELVVLGRHGEPPGRYRSRLRCVLDGTPLLHDETRIGDRDRTAVDLAGATAYGSLALLGLDPGDGVADVLRLAGPGAVVRALAPEAAALHARLAATEATWLAAIGAGATAVR